MPVLGHPSIDSSSVDGDMGVAAGGKGCPVPVTPTALQLQPSDSRHEVELAWPRIPLYDRIQADTRVHEGHVTLLKHLSSRVMAQQIQLDLTNFDGLCIHILIVAQPVKEGRHKSLHDERAIIGEMTGS